jgi:hypothetical protein
MRKRVLFVVVAAMLLLGVIGVAYASIPGPDGVIHGCYKTSNPAQGALIAIDFAASCPSGYTALNWNQTGLQGPTGPQGETGPVGPAGGLNGYEFITQPITIDAFRGSTFYAYCSDVSKRVLGGGTSARTGKFGDLDVEASYPINGDGVELSGWAVWIYNSNTTARQPTLYATCATVAS